MPVQFQIPAPDQASFGSRGLAISPDGRRLAFIANGSDGRAMLWVRALDTLVAQAMPGTDGASYLPFWSPDSRSIGFLAQGKLKKIDAGGGPPQTLCELPGVLVGGSWNPDGVIIFGSATGGLYRVSQAGGIPAQLTTLNESKGELGHMRPWFLPGGQHFLYFLRTRQLEEGGIFLATLDGRTRKRLVGSSQAGAYAPPVAGSEYGHLLFLREGTLMALPLDAKRYEPAGDPFPVAERVGATQALGLFSVSANGVLAYRTGSSGRGTQLVWFDREGKPIANLGSPLDSNGLNLSRDGKRVALDRIESGNRDIWVMDAMRGVPTRFTFDASNDGLPVWSPSGTRLAFASARGGGGDMNEIYQKDSSGSGTEELLLKSPEGARPTDWGSTSQPSRFRN